MTPLALPPGYTRIQCVNSFQELLSTPLANGVNALCWPRTLSGNFSEVVTALCDSTQGIGDGITPLDETRLRALSVSASGRTAIDFMLEDLRLLREHGRAPELNCIRAYPREEEPTVVPIDVYSYHADSAPVEADTWLCTYHGASSEGLRNDETRRRVDVPETRAELLKLFGGEDDKSFREFLNENCYDLHYAPAPGAQPFSFGLGNLWRIATDWPGSPVPPCVHRAPENLPGQPPRLLLIS
ncbi:hypothetical protein CMV30_03390 [Nibricoccus aquaticus]|uniref:DUF1826 domain-containing protein n=1 Tax=Nibricoccus aquaticus TaxID=2576891 RepID=A0A290Q328_9BACT|nr:hypothetical protein [Nibricoccus aquaticus]ATC63075.1 hypothetical protein CMV30_03390 [Nibricoccus aquaticus]